MQERRRVGLTLLQPQPGETILDAGCGPGGYAPAIRAAGARWIGIDASLGMLAFGSSEGQVMRGSTNILPVRDGAVSALLGIELADYLQKGPLVSFACEAARVLAYGGRAVLSCNASRRGPGFSGLRTGELGSDPAALQMVLLAAGLTIESEERLHGGLLSPDTLLFLVRKP